MPPSSKQSSSSPSVGKKIKYFPRVEKAEQLITKGHMAQFGALVGMKMREEFREQVREVFVDVLRKLMKKSILLVAVDEVGKSTTSNGTCSWNVGGNTVDMSFRSELSYKLMGVSSNNQEDDSDYHDEEEEESEVIIVSDDEDFENYVDEEEIEEEDE